MARKWLEGAAGLRLETVTKPFTKRTDNRADELISVSLIITKQPWDYHDCYNNKPQFI